MKTTNSAVFTEEYVLFDPNETTLNNFVDSIKNETDLGKVTIFEASGVRYAKLIAKNERNLIMLRKRFFGALDTYVILKQNQTLEEGFFACLKERNLTVSTAESVTGGMVASRILDVKGASQIFKESYIVYADEAKHRVLNVAKETLEKYTAVSFEAAREMAKNTQLITNSDIVIATTGYAGPTGGTLDDPVGTVYYGFWIDGSVSTLKKRFTGQRNMIRQKASAYALGHVINQLIIK
jgi:nicotinamide-nucleotide amidase